MWVVSGVYGIATDSMVIDEAEHLAAAVQYIDSGTQTINAFHTPLLKLIAGIPLLYKSPRHERYKWDAWKKSNCSSKGEKGHQSQTCLASKAQWQTNIEKPIIANIGVSNLYK